MRRTSKHVRLKHHWPLHWQGDHGPRGGLWHLSGAQATVAAAVKPIMGTLVCSRAPLGLVLAVGNGAGGPGVLAHAGCTDQGLGALGLCPEHVGLGCEAEHIGGPQLLLTLRAPSLLPSPVAALRRDMGVVLGADRAVLPAVPLASAGPRRLTWVGHQHPLPHDSLHRAACQLDSPRKTNDKDHCADVVPRRHVHLGQWIIAECIVRTVLTLLSKLLVGLGWGDKIHDVLEGTRKPSWGIACTALIEEAATGLLGLVVRLAMKRFGH
mmetsp:Transcript_1932/g.4715  ORF Transcript_1932/g.4715 Transcript_1932/m.4715 type:complete len:267 (-) Transcript_1932:1324-2124(-)